MPLLSEAENDVLPTGIDPNAVAANPEGWAAAEQGATAQEVTHPGSTFLPTQESVTGQPPDPIQVPPTVGINDPSVPLGGNIELGDTSDPAAAAGPTVQDLYPEGGEIGPVVAADAGVIPDPTGATVTETDASVTEFDVDQAAGSTDRITGLLDQGGGGIDASQTDLTEEQQVEAELARILGKDSPLLAQARAEAARYANSRGLQNTSMAAGMTQDAMVRAALPMAQQNASQAFQREGANTQLRQGADQFTAEQQNRLTALEAELGQTLNLFNADQLNQAEEIMAQMRTALESQDAKAYNDAAQQLANLQRDAQAQQSELDYRASQAEADAINQRNTQIIDSVTRLNQQYLQNMGAADIANIEGTYRQLISTNQTAGNIFSTGLSAMAALMDNPDMTPEQVQSGIRVIQETIEASLRMLSNINDMDFDGTPATGEPGGPAGPLPDYVPPPIPGGDATDGTVPPGDQYGGEYH